MEKCLSDMASPKEKAYIGGIIKEFKNTDAYLILHMNSESYIHNQLTIGRGQNSISAEYQLGKLEGVQYLEDSIRGFIADAEIPKQDDDTDYEPDELGEGLVAKKKGDSHAA